MRVILLQDIDNLGKKHEVKEVKPGFARNFLFKKELARPATKEAMKWLEVQKEIAEQKAEEDLKKIQELAASVEGQEIIFLVKIGEKDQLFESITVQKIAEKLKEFGFDIKKNQINLEKPIKEIGEFPVRIRFEHNLEAQIRVVVSEEEK